MTQKPPDQLLDPDGVMYLVAGPNGSPATVEVEGEPIACCGFFREAAERVKLPGKAWNPVACRSSTESGD